MNNTFFTILDENSLVECDGGKIIDFLTKASDKLGPIDLAIDFFIGFGKGFSDAFKK